jgi:hypothetical protein
MIFPKPASRPTRQKRPSIEVAASGLVYRNPKPHLRAVHAMHPSLSVLSARELVATFDLGQGPESLDYHTELSRSTDGGRTWQLQGPLIQPPKGRRTSHSIRTSRLSNGRMVGIGGLFYRDDPEEGLLNRDNLGYVPMKLFLVESRNDGRRWSAPRVIRPPFACPAWELSHPIRELPDRSWIAPLAAWRGWNGKLPCGEQAGVMISADGGRTWPTWGRSFDGRKSGIIYWEQSVVCLQDGCLLSVAWVYDPKTGRTRPSLYTLSNDGGRTFALPRPTGFLAQTCKLLHLGNNRVLATYRRDDRPGLWANLVRIEGGRWINLCRAPLWLGAVSGMAGKGNRSEELSGLKFGYPSAACLPNGDVMLVFWCVEDCISNIRWMRLKVKL